MCEGARADHGAGGLAVDEQHDRRQRQDLVARGGVGILVRVHALDRDAVGERRQDRLERLARLAPGRPELEQLRVAHRAVRRRSGTRVIASSTMPRLIFDVPSVRSAKTIGTSTTLKPRRIARYVISIWNAYPFASIASK